MTTAEAKQAMLTVPCDTCLLTPLLHLLEWPEVRWVPDRDCRDTGELTFTSRRDADEARRVLNALDPYPEEH